MTRNDKSPKNTPVSETPYVEILWAYDKVGELESHANYTYPYIDDARPSFAGYGTPGSIITLYDGDTVIGSVTAASDGYWSFMPEVPLETGRHEIIAQVGDGLAPGSSSSFELIVDTRSIEPGKLVINSAYDHLSPQDQAYVANNKSSKDNKPTLEGTAEPGAIVTVHDGANNPIGSTQADQYGNWSFTPTTPLSDGTHNLIAVTAQGQSDPFIMTVDSTLASPTFSPHMTDDVGAIGGSLESGSVTDDTQPEFHGTGAPNTLIVIHDGANNPIGSTMTDRWGKWSLTPDTPLGEGTHNIFVVAVDGQSNGPFVVNVDTTPAPTINVYVIDDVGAPTHAYNGETIDDPRPTMSGTGAVNSIVIIHDGANNPIGSTQVGANGLWEFTPEYPLKDGTHELIVVSADGQSTAPFTLTIDSNGPAPIIYDAYDDVGNHEYLYKGSLTDDARPTLSGNAQSNAVITLFDGANNPIGSVQADQFGRWEFTPKEALSDGSHTFTAVDKHGQSSGTFVIHVDTSGSDPGPGPAPTIDGGYDDVGNPEYLYNGSLTDDARPTLNGNAQANAVITLFDGANNPIGSVQADQFGRWEFTPKEALSDGSHTFTAVDKHGQSSGIFVIHVDTTGPTPTIDGGYDDVGNHGYSLPEDLSLNDVISNGESNLFAATNTAATEELTLPEIDITAVEQDMTTAGADTSGYSATFANSLLPEEELTGTI